MRWPILGLVLAASSLLWASWPQPVGACMLMCPHSTELELSLIGITLIEGEPAEHVPEWADEGLLSIRIDGIPWGLQVGDVSVWPEEER